MDKFEKMISDIDTLKECDTLDIFAREGDWQSIALNNRVKSIEAWELEQKFIPKLSVNLPSAKVVCHDSISFINNTQDYKKFDLVVIDNGLNCYGDGYCEHFDFLHKIKHFLKPEAYVVFNVVLHPFNYDNNKVWQERRNSFYGLKDCSHLSLDFIEKFYTRFFGNKGLTTKQYKMICREHHMGVDYLYYVGMKLKQ